ncbi:cyclic pyranopterin monophosphate synthase MoaC [Porticoccaceae bacterium]|jgi:cyclic pyranopterin monophosphate synthase|nr:cyclic pyranopterin monophosphate synthase MoaC [Porticoccaceae bacterium]
MSKLSHIDQQGKSRMVDVGDKFITRRVAVAQTKVIFPLEAYNKLQQKQLSSTKGSIIDTANIAGVMAAKRTADLIPMCHPLPIDFCKLDFTQIDEECSLLIQAEVRVNHKTGVEMEALTAASVAALTIYDMCKALSHDIRINDLQLVNKTGGKSDFTMDS